MRGFDEKGTLVTLQREESFFYDHSHLDNNILQRGRAPPCLLCNDADGLCEANEIYVSISQTIHFFISLQGPLSHRHQRRYSTAYGVEWASPQHSQLAEEVNRENI